MKLSLGQKFILSIETVVVIFSILTGIVTYYIFQKSLVERTLLHLQSISVLKENVVKQYLRDAELEINFFVNNERRHKLLVEMLTKAKSTEVKNILEEFSETIKDGHIFRDILLLDNNGAVLISTNPKDEGKIKDVNSIDSGFYHDVTTNETAIAIMVPVTDKTGATLGILMSRLRIEEISKLMMERSGFGKSGETFIVNSANTVVTDLLKAPGSSLKKTLYLPQIEMCLLGKSNFEGRKDYQGVAVFGYWKWFPEIKSCLVTKIDQSEALAPILNMVTLLSLVMLIIAIIVGLAGFVIGKLITKPLIYLRDEVKKISDGNFDVRCKVDSQDEIGQVANVFNEMAKRLAEIYANLENKVKEKTVELSTRLVEMDKLNGDMKKNEQAMINILEDEKALEDELRVEKENVEKKVVERTLELSNAKAKLDSSIENLPLGFAMVDVKMELTVINELAKTVLGGKDNQDCFVSLKKILKKEIDLEKYIKNCSLEKRINISDIEINDRTYKFLISPVMVTEVKAICIGVVVLIEDITEAKILERSKDEFFSIASHELRTPLTAIRGNTSMIQEYYKEQIKDPELNSMISDIHDSSVRLIEIVNDFLNISRLEQGRMEFTKEKINIDEVIASVISEFEVTGSRKKIAIESIKFNGKLPVVVGDMGKIKQILINMIGNSLKFTTEGKIVIKTEVVDKFVKILVTDTGRGISVKQQDLLFHKFQQAGASLFTRDTAGGTGLGLYISKKMVEGMGGEIKLEKSQEGKGSTFSFTLPMVKIK